MPCVMEPLLFYGTIHDFGFLVSLLVSLLPWRTGRVILCIAFEDHRMVEENSPRYSVT